ncbi:MAG: DUF2244 domain-containing protein [Proteobacteria bacterium]|nr:DUF2244 domain-containing protein [Pseudomonadota bacterium]
MGAFEKGILIMPNKAMPWHQLVWIYSTIASFTIGVALGFFSQGLTLILPFAGLEVVALGVVLYVSAWRGGVKEVVSVTEDKIRIETGHDAPEQQHELKRVWAQVVLERSWNNWYPSRLFIRSHGQQGEIGRFLNEAERQGLAQALQKLIKN